MRAGCPQVITLELPQEDGKQARYLRHCWPLDTFSVTREDTSKTKLMVAELDRRANAQMAISFASFIDSLDLQV